MDNKNYTELLIDLVEEFYTPSWQHFLDCLTDDDMSDLAERYWLDLEDDKKDYWLSDQDFRVGLIDLSDFFLSRIIEDLESKYFEYEFNNLYNQDEDNSYNRIRSLNDVVRYSNG